MRQRANLAPFLLILGLATICYIYSHLSLFTTPSEEKVRAENLIALKKWLIPTIVVEIIAGEFKGTVADLIMLETSAQLGSTAIPNKEKDWNALFRLFKHSMALDPHFQQTYMLAQGWFPWTVKRVDQANEILATARQHRPWDWRPTHLIGFNTYFFMQEHGEAGKIFLEASKLPNAPPYLAIVGSRLAQKGGETEAAIGLMKTMLATKDESDLGYEDMVERLQALEGVLILERAMQQYEAKFHHHPADLTALINAGIIAALPPNPYGLSYCLDAGGAIHFDNPACRSSP